MTLSPQEFATRIRAKFPGAYDDLSDEDLTKRVVTAMPEYRDMVQVAPVPAGRPQIAQPQTGAAQRVPTNLLNRMGVSGEEIKRRAAAGEQNIQAGEGLRPGSNAEQFGAYLADAGIGLVKGTAEMGGLAADGLRNQYLVAKGIVTGNGVKVDDLTALPATRAVGDAVVRGGKSVKRAAGLTDLATEPAGEVAQFVGEVFAPGPEVAQASRAARSIGMGRASEVINESIAASRGAPAEAVKVLERAISHGSVSLDDAAERFGLNASEVGEYATFLRSQPYLQEATPGRFVVRDDAFAGAILDRARRSAPDPAVAVAGVANPAISGAAARVAREAATSLSPATEHSRAFSERVREGSGGLPISKRQRNTVTGELRTVYSSDGGQTWHPQASGGEPTSSEIVPWEMDYDDLVRERDAAKAADSDIDIAVFGEAGAKRYRALQRKANSTIDHEGADAAFEELRRMEESLPKRARDRLFGIGDESYVAPDDLDAFVRGLDALDDSSPEALGYSLKYAVTRIGGTEGDIASLPLQSQVAAAQMRRAFEIAQANGWDPNQVLHSAMRAAATRFEPDEVAFMLRRFKAGAGAAPRRTPTRPLRVEGARDGAGWMLPENGNVTAGRFIAPSAEEEAFLRMHQNADAGMPMNQAIGQYYAEAERAWREAQMPIPEPRGALSRAADDLVKRLGVGREDASYLLEQGLLLEDSPHIERLRSQGYLDRIAQPTDKLEAEIARARMRAGAFSDDTGGIERSGAVSEMTARMGTASPATAPTRTATNPQTGQRIGTNDGVTWYDLVTGEKVPTRADATPTSPQGAVGAAASVPRGTGVAPPSPPTPPPARPGDGSPPLGPGDGSFDANTYVRQQIAKREVARGDKPDRLSWFEFKRTMVDFAAPIEDALDDAIKAHGLNLLPSQHISNNIDRVLRAPHIAGQFARDHGLERAIQRAPSLDHLDQYLIARHALGVLEQHMDGGALSRWHRVAGSSGRSRGSNEIVDLYAQRFGRDFDADRALVESLRPTYDPIAREVADYSRALLDRSVESGLISRELAGRLKEIYPDYVPLERVFSAVEQGHAWTGGRAVASLPKQTIVRALHGSTREVENPLAALIAKTGDVILQSERNKAARLLASYEALPGNPFGLRELAEGEQIPSDRVITFLDNGVKRRFETLPEIARAAKALDVQRLGPILNVLAAPTRVARVGMTGLNPKFIATNIVRDQLAGVINSGVPLRDIAANLGRGLFEGFNHGALYDEAVREGALFTSFDAARNQAPITLERMRAGRDVGSKVKYTLRHGGELLRQAEDLVGRAENATRLQHYAAGRDAALKRGLPIEEARIAGAMNARKATVNFARRGEWGRAINAVWLYSNARIQGARTGFSAAQDHPGTFALRAGLGVLTPVMMVTAWNLKDPQRRAVYADIPQWEKDKYLIVIPPSPEKDEHGRWQVYKFPIPQEIAPLATLPRNVLESAYRVDPLRFADFAHAILGSAGGTTSVNETLSVLTPQFLKPTLEVSANHNLFTGGPIVPPQLERVPEQERAYPNTSGTARILGAATHTSPLGVQHFVNATAGGVGTMVMNWADTALAHAGVIPPEQVGGEGFVDGLDRRFTSAGSGAVERKEYERAKEDADAAARAAYWQSLLGK